MHTDTFNLYRVSLRSDTLRAMARDYRLNCREVVIHESPRLVFYQSDYIDSPELDLHKQADFWAD
jgi:hypothetical protein